jgi:hypothetical protein
MRASGILMPVFSLPGPFGIGTLGAEAFAFVDFLARARQTYWQILPIGPTGYGDSPYQSFSAFAGNPYFIDYRVLAEDGWLTPDEVPAPVPVGTVDYGALYNERPAILKRAADRLLAEPSKAYTDFCAAQDFWLDDYALFMALKAEQGQAGLVGVKLFQGAVQTVDGGGDTADPAGQMPNGCPHLLLGGGVKIAAGVAGNRDPGPAQLIDKLPKLCALDGKGPFQFPAGCGAQSTRMVSPQMLRKQFLLHGCLLSGAFFRKRAQKNRDRYPLRKNGPCVFLFCCYRITPNPRRSRTQSNAPWR